MKIGVVTIYSVPNFGSVLQAYATQELFCSLGHECVIIRYDYFSEIRKNQRHSIFRLIKSLIIDHIPFLKSSKLRKFRSRYLHFSKNFQCLNDLNNGDWKSYDAIIVGSDQVWNTRFNGGDPAFLLSFVPDEIPKLSLSSSFALKQLPDEYIPIFRSELSKFKALSVREQNGVNIINNDLGILSPVKVTLDPTLLLNREQWMNLIPRSGFKKIKPYILVYLWTYAFDPRPYVEKIIEYYYSQTNYEIRVLEGHRLLNNLHVPFIDENRSSISRFIDLFANADLVITSSFHGTAFAANFGIPLISIVPDGGSDDRQSTLLNTLSLSNCITHVGDDIPLLIPTYNKENEQKRLAELRFDSINWVEQQLNNLQ